WRRSHGPQLETIELALQSHTAGQLDAAAARARVDKRHGRAGSGAAGPASEPMEQMAHHARANVRIICKQAFSGKHESGVIRSHHNVLQRRPDDVLPGAFRGGGGPRQTRYAPYRSRTDALQLRQHAMT